MVKIPPYIRIGNCESNLATHNSCLLCPFCAQCIFSVSCPPCPSPSIPSIPYINGDFVSRFLEEWELDCDDYGVRAEQRCQRLPLYCIDEINDIVRNLPGYAERDWETLKANFKNLYWQRDKPGNTTVALHTLIRSAREGRIDLNVYILQYKTISNALVTAGALSSLDQIYRLLDGLKDDVRKRALGYIAKQKWKMSPLDSNTVAPVFSDLKDFINEQAMVGQMESMYVRDRSMREGSPSGLVHASNLSVTLSPQQPSPPLAAAPTPSATPAAASTPTTTSTSDPGMAELIKMFGDLALAIKAQPFIPPTSAPTTTQAPAPGNRPTRPPHLHLV